MFINELDVLKKLDHPNVMKLYGITAKNPFFLIMESARYGSVLNILSKDQRDIKINFPLIINIAQQISSGLNF